MEKRKKITGIATTAALAVAFTAGGFMTWNQPSADAKMKGPKVKIVSVISSVKNNTRKELDKSKKKSAKTVQTTVTSTSYDIRFQKNKKYYLKVNEKAYWKKAGDKKAEKLYTKTKFLKPGKGKTRCFTLTAAQEKMDGKLKSSNHEIITAQYCKKNKKGKYTAVSKTTKVTLKFAKNGKIKYSVSR